MEMPASAHQRVDVFDLGREWDDACVLGSIEREQDRAEAGTGLEGARTLIHGRVDEPEHLVGKRERDLTIAGPVQGGVGLEQLA